MAEGVKLKVILDSGMNIRFCCSLYNFWCMLKSVVYFSQLILKAMDIVWGDVTEYWVGGRVSGVPQSAADISAETGIQSSPKESIHFCRAGYSKLMGSDGT